MKKIFLTLFIITIITSCKQKELADLIIVNATVYTVNSNFDIATSFAIKDGEFIAIGNTKEIQNKYTASKVIDVKNKSIYPGFIDGHCHFYELGMQGQKVDVTGTKSYDEVLQKLVAFQQKKNVDYITGRGWDQNDWVIKEFPTKKKLDSLFPKTPVAIRRIDGLAMLVNQAALDLAGISEKTEVHGGELIKQQGELTGVLTDNAMLLIHTPKPTKEKQIQALIEAEKINFSYGLTTVDDAGLERDIIELIDSLQQVDLLKIRVYAMANASKNNLDYYSKKGILKTNKLSVRSFKVYGDGSLGSRGAALKHPYNDRHNHYGALRMPHKKYREIAAQIAKTDFQMNTHAIGDSTNYLILKIYKDALKGQKDRRWRIEHAQIIDNNDFKLFENIIPSVQPTHATSDMYWAKDRMGTKRLKGGYAYKKLLNSYGKVALGSDYPVEKVNPFLTFYAAVVRKDLNNYPENGFQIENALTRKETLRGMTIWNAYANFEEQEKGSIEVGKFADFVILNQDIMKVKDNDIPKTKVISTYINGEKVYE